MSKELETKIKTARALYEELILQPASSAAWFQAVDLSVDMLMREHIRRLEQQKLNELSSADND